MLHTVIAWSRKGFRFYWRWKNRGRQGRPCTASDIRYSKLEKSVCCKQEEQLLPVSVTGSIEKSLLGFGLSCIWLLMQNQLSGDVSQTKGHSVAKGR